MGFLRRLVGGGPETRDGAGEPASGGDTGAPGLSEANEGTTPDEDESARNRELLREEAERLNDGLLQRQLRYADRSWVPPSQGGSQRSGDAGAPED